MIRRSKVFFKYFECFVRKYTTTTSPKMEGFDHKNQLIKIFLESVSAVNPSKLIMENLRLDGRNLHICDKVFNVSDTNIYLVGFGKAVLGMASQCENVLGDRLKRGVICIPENIRETCENGLKFSLRENSVIQIFEGARNNLPDEKAERGTDAIIELVKSLTSKHDILITLISGGGSALLPKPVSGISLREKLKTINLLTSSGATITELNTVRKRLSKVKGGGLAGLSFPVQTLSLILSDVINDPLGIIASGPLVPNFDAENSAYDILKKYQLDNKLPESVLKAVLEPRSMLSVPIVNDTFAHVNNFIIGNNVKALNSAKQYSEGCGFKTIILTSKIKGLVKDVADFYERLLCKVMTSIQNKDGSHILIDKENLFQNNFDCESNFLNELSLLMNNWGDEMKMCVIAGGETTVEVTGDGKGGRNQELALIMSLKLHKLKVKFPTFFDKHDIKFLSAGTDGIDGPTNAAGALGEAYLIEKALKIGLNVDSFLKRNDSYNFFDKINGKYLIKTGHTGTNVMDIHILLVYRRRVLDPE